MINHFNRNKIDVSLSMPLVDHLHVAEDHAVLALSQVLGHRDLRALLLFGLAHVVDVLTALRQVRHVVLLAVDELAHAPLALLEGTYCLCLLLLFQLGLGENLLHFHVRVARLVAVGQIGQSRLTFPRLGLQKFYRHFQ